MKTVTARLLAIAAAIAATVAVPTTAAAGTVSGGCPAYASIATDHRYEGTHAGTTTFSFAVTLSVDPMCGEPTGSVTYQTADGSPGATGSDYVGTSGTLTWTADHAPRTIPVAVNADAGPEPDEPFWVSLTKPTGDVVIGTQITNGLIYDDDGYTGPPLVWSLDGGKICWRDPVGLRAANSLCRVTVKLGRVVSPVSVHYRTVATGGGSPGYVPVQDAVVTIQPGSTTGTAVVQVLPGSRPDEKFLLELFSPSAGTVGLGSTEVTIKSP